jgi:hypothetical protein
MPFVSGTFPLINSPRAAERFEALDLSRLVAVHGMPQVPVLLQAEPEVGRHADDPGQPQGRVGRDAALAAHDFVQPRERDVHPLGKLRLRDRQRHEKFFAQHLARVSRRPVPRQSARHQIATAFAASASRMGV